MKKKYILYHCTLLIVFLFVLAGAVFADAPPDPGGDPGGPGGGTPVGGGSPVGAGLFLLLTMGFTYGLKKIITHNRDEENF